MKNIKTILMILLTLAFCIILILAIRRLLNAQLS